MQQKPSQLNPPHHPDLEQPTYFRLIIPAPRPTINLCKTLVSAAALDYPTPVLTSWYRSELTNDVQAGILRFTEINGILNYLNSIPPRNDADIVVIIDGYNTLFQLRPSVLLQRYYQLNRLANARILAQLGPAAGITQRVIFAAQRKCQPPDAPTCAAVPEPLLPPDIFGPEADDGSNARPRWLASGFAIGPLADLRALYTRAAAKALADPAAATDQSVFSAIFGEQEAARTRLASSTSTNSSSSFPSEELAMGIDTLSTLIHGTAHAPRDATFMSLALQNAALPASAPRMHLPADIALSTPPYWSYTASAATHAYAAALPANTSWAQVPLLTNVFTRAVPVAINLKRDVASASDPDAAAVAKAWWTQTWMFPFGRALLERRVVEPVRPVARLPVALVSLDAAYTPPAYDARAAQYVLGDTQARTRMHEWWSEKDRRDGVALDLGAFLTYAQVCAGEMVDGRGEGVFEDGKGVFRAPEMWVAQ